MKIFKYRLKSIVLFVACSTLISISSISLLHRQYDIGNKAQNKKIRQRHFDPVQFETSETWGSFNREVGLPTVMMATSEYQQDLVQTKYTEDACPKRCRLVSYRTAPDEILTANALLFHLIWTDLNMTWIRELHNQRDPNQIWVFYSFEPPHVISSQLPVEIRPKIGDNFDNFFNWTLTYRLDSDMTKLFSNYGGYKRINKTVEKVPLGKKRHMAALMSNCPSPFDREALLKEFKQLGLEVDFYGKCGNKGCPGDRMGDECYKYLEERYLFFASFENSLCPDYVTEKIFYIFNYNMVPVVVGGANYSKVAPPHSYIDVRSFGSASQVVALLKEIAANETMFNSYFAWKGHLELRNDTIGNDIFCSTCQKLHETYAKPKKTIQIYDDFEGWWELKRPCGTDQFYRGLS